MQKRKKKKNDCICHSHGGNLIRQHTVIWSIRVLQIKASRAVWDRTWTFCLEKGHLMHFFTSMVKSFAFWSWWRHHMETFSALLALCAGNSPVPGEFPALRPWQWRGALIFSLICVWINGWVNNRESGDLRHHRAHYDVTVMFFSG